MVTSDFENEDNWRTLAHSQKARATLKNLRQALLARHSDQIGYLITDSFRQLLRKSTLVEDVRIDPETFRVELRGQGGYVLPSDRLSAGERQILAVSMLWGLARASGRPLPTIIDTPLGRLDSSHRTHLVERYFPKASHQVLLLSTDEEIDKRYLKKLKPYIGRTYHFDYDDKTASTKIRPGYFWKD